MKLHPAIITCFVFLVSCTNQCLGAEKASPKFNVLFIAVDDLRPELGCYGTCRSSPQILMRGERDCSLTELIVSFAFAILPCVRFSRVADRSRFKSMILKRSSARTAEHRHVAAVV